MIAGEAPDKLSIGGKPFGFFSVRNAGASAPGGFDDLPYSLKVLLENALRNANSKQEITRSIDAFARWTREPTYTTELDFFPTRIMMHDVSGIPLLADLAAMREHFAKLERAPDLVNPLRPVDFVMDHSVTVDFAGRGDALQQNTKLEYARNIERYRVVKWAQTTFRNLRVLPPGQGICHQINLESLARVVWRETDHRHGEILFPDSLVAGDSHTPMINALSVLGWGVGAIEALSAMLGEPISMMLPQVVGVRLLGRPRGGTTTTDLALALTRRLREHGVVQKFVEFVGPGLDALSLPERATLANMAPEYGASVAYFPTDDETLNYLRLTGRGEHAPVVEAYSKEQGLWRDETVRRIYSDEIEFDLNDVEASVAGPRLPQQQVSLGQAHLSAQTAIASQCSPTRADDGGVRDGDVVIAAITSCTNTSNPRVMLAAGLLAQRAVERGLQVPSSVKTSLSPGSRTVADYLQAAGLMAPLEALGFHVTGYGCMTCCGGSGALSEDVSSAINTQQRDVAAVLSGNRNFEGRIHPQVKLGYLASPPLVIAYALLGSVTRDITTEPLGSGVDGVPVYLRDIWPSAREVDALIRTHITPAMFASRNATMSLGDGQWDAIEIETGDLFAWEPHSTYILKPPFLETASPMRLGDGINDAAILAMFGDHVTTDHISPGSAILAGTLAGDYLAAKGSKTHEFSGFLQRRTNHEVMMRGTFNNPHIQNEMTPDQGGGWTVHYPSGERMTVFAAHQRYRAEGRNVVIVAGAEYGTGSSRDWAARGPHLLGVKAVLAESFERIHRSNLVGMGILPLQFINGESRITLGLDGCERVEIAGFDHHAEPRQHVAVTFTRSDGEVMKIRMLGRLDTAREVAWMAAGGVMPYVLNKLSKGA
jgi:aconitate hydratase